MTDVFLPGMKKKYAHAYLLTHDRTPGVKSIFCMPGRSYQRACQTLPKLATPVPLPFSLALVLIILIRP